MKASDSLWGAVRTVDGYVQSVHVNDSRVPYFNLALGFLVVEYVFHTYLDIRQRKVRDVCLGCVTCTLQSLLGRTFACLVQPRVWGFAECYMPEAYHKSTLQAKHLQCTVCSCGLLASSQAQL